METSVPELSDYAFDIQGNIEDGGDATEQERIKNLIVTYYKDGLITEWEKIYLFRLFSNKFRPKPVKPTPPMNKVEKNNVAWGTLIFGALFSVLLLGFVTWAICKDSHRPPIHAHTQEVTSQFAFPENMKDCHMYTMVSEGGAQYKEVTICPHATTTTTRFGIKGPSFSETVNQP